MYRNSYYPFYNYNNMRFKKINWSRLLDGTQKTLGIINQAIPVIYQIKPLYENAKTAFKVVNIMNKDDKKINKTIKKVEPSNSPTYFL